ncbi:hypothetical protein COOONC_12528 [Cooperia oncophora]
MNQIFLDDARHSLMQEIPPSTRKYTCRRSRNQRTNKRLSYDEGQPHDTKQHYTEEHDYHKKYPHDKKHDCDEKHNCEHDKKHDYEPSDSTSQQCVLICVFIYVIFNIF